MCVCVCVCVCVMGIVWAVFTRHKPENLRKGQDLTTSIHQRNCFVNLAANHSPTHIAYHKTLSIPYKNIIAEIEPSICHPFQTDRKIPFFKISLLSSFLTAILLTVYNQEKRNNHI